MSEIAICVEKLSKRYRIGARQKQVNGLGGSLRHLIASPFEYLYATFRSPTEEETLWALKDVSFEVKHGEVVGIIGRNGAGKSTLLKILSRITEPTEGRARVYGRVGSLLEVGTGFHLELTGRENVYMNGAILGMNRAEINRKFDEIVAFAGVEKFIDTTIKRYSSGMQVRLAFAVAAHLEPEILLVDEVLAVGDAEFQKKCLGKMGEVAKGGRTILFVSHQLNQIRRLCARCIWVDAGHIRRDGPTVEVMSAYEVDLSRIAKNKSRANRDASTRSCTHFLGWEIITPRSNKLNLLTTSEALVFKMMLQVDKPIRNGQHGIALWNNNGQLVWAWAAQDVKMAVGLNELVYKIPGLPLNPGVYYWQVSIYENSVLLDNWHCVPELIIATEPQTHPRDEWNGILNLPCDFTINPLECE